METVRFIDMFCGIGGFRLGLERRIIENLPPKVKRGCQEEEDQKARVETRQPSEFIDRDRNRFFDCVWSNDNDKYACQIYRQHFGEVYEGDIRAVDADAIPEHNLLCAGFPCQSFSIAGKRRGFEDTRGTLFFEICRILRAKRPGLLFLENVKGLLSADEGSTFQTIIQSLDELGYDLQWQVLNSKDYGVPQNRERVFIIGHLREQPRPKVFPIGETDEMDTRQVVGLQDTQTAVALRSTDYKGTHNMIATALSARQNKDGTAIIGDNTIRRLTPIECERLQGFPDNWTQGISDSQRYKCLGNAVTVNVIEAIGRQLKQSITSYNL